MDKRLLIVLQGGRKVSGVLRGFDIFLNLVVDEAVEESGIVAASGGAKNQLGQIVCHHDFRFVSLTNLLYSQGDPRE